MGFRTGAYAKVWEITPIRDNSTKLRISTSRKNKQTGDFEQDFSGFVLCFGTSAAQKAAKLNKGDRIKLGDCDVTTKYDKDRRITYTNYALFSFDVMGGSPSYVPAPDPADPRPEVDGGEADEHQLPY